MATYLMQLFDPMGAELHAARIEMEDLEDIDSLTGLMTRSDGQRYDSHRFKIEGGYDPRAAYSVAFTRQ